MTEPAPNSQPNSPQAAPTVQAAPANPPAAPTAPSAASSPPNQPDPANPPAPAARPENVPEQFWDAEKNSLKTDDLLKAYVPLAEKAKAEAERLAAYPKTAAELKLEIPAGALGEGVKVELDPSNPLVAPARDLIFNKKLDPALLGDLAAIYVKQQLAEQKHFEEMRGAEMKKLGDNAGARIDAVKQFITKFGGEGAEAVSEHIFTAKQYGVFENLMKAFSSQGAAPANASPNPPTQLKPKAERRIGDGWYGEPQQKAS